MSVAMTWIAEKSLLWRLKCSFTNDHINNHFSISRMCLCCLLHTTNWNLCATIHDSYSVRAHKDVKKWGEWRYTSVPRTDQVLLCTQAIIYRDFLLMKCQYTYSMSLFRIVIESEEVIWWIVFSGIICINFWTIMTHVSAWVVRQPLNILGS